MVDIVLFDLDGVIRQFPPVLEGDLIGPVAFEPGLLRRVVTGQISDAAWRAEVARHVGDAAVAAWSESCGSVDADVLAIVRAVRVQTRVGVLTNGTTRLRSDLSRLGITDGFDAIFNSSELGVAKPDPAVYEVVCTMLDVAADSVFFVDDSPSHVDGARRAGLRAALFVDAVLLADALRAEGVLD